MLQCAAVSDVTFRIPFSLHLNTAPLSFCFSTEKSSNPAPAPADTPEFQPQCQCNCSSLHCTALLRRLLCCCCCRRGDASGRRGKRHDGACSAVGARLRHRTPRTALITAGRPLGAATGRSTLSCSGRSPCSVMEGSPGHHQGNLLA